MQIGPLAARPRASVGSSARGLRRRRPPALSVSQCAVGLCALLRRAAHGSRSSRRPAGRSRVSRPPRARACSRLVPGCRARPLERSAEPLRRSPSRCGSRASVGSSARGLVDGDPQRSWYPSVPWGPAHCCGALLRRTRPRFPIEPSPGRAQGVAYGTYLRPGCFPSCPRPPRTAPRSGVRSPWERGPCSAAPSAPDPFAGELVLQVQVVGLYPAEHRQVDCPTLKT